MNANARIQWLHKKLSMGSYPNSQRLAERFQISHRQAQRDLDYLKKELGAPIAYDNARRGFYYTEPFTLPVLLTSDNDDLYMPEAFRASSKRELGAEESIIQMQIPYTATLHITNKLAAMELDSYIVSRLPGNRYLCEFHSIQRFIGHLLSMDADLRIEEPSWLREQIYKSAARILQNNQEIEEE